MFTASGDGGDVESGNNGSGVGGMTMFGGGRGGQANNPPQTQSNPVGLWLHAFTFHVDILMYMSPPFHSFRVLEDLCHLAAGAVVGVAASTL